jgi:glutamine amidotransferase
MQMLFDASEESPGVAGLGIIHGAVRTLAGPVKRPQMQWNVVDVLADDPLFAGLGPRPWFYFVHSLHGDPEDPALVTATCDYGGTVNAAFRSGNVAAVQFHPEKSAGAGLALLGNFVAEVARGAGVATVR